MFEYTTILSGYKVRIESNDDFNAVVRYVAFIVNGTWKSHTSNYTFNNNFLFVIASNNVIVHDKVEAQITPKRVGEMNVCGDIKLPSHDKCMNQNDIEDERHRLTLLNGMGPMEIRSINHIYKSVTILQNHTGTAETTLNDCLKSKEEYIVCFGINIIIIPTNRLTKCNTQYMS